jgi:DNA-binding MarR family transcriptional regulator
MNEQADRDTRVDSAWPRNRALMASLGNCFLTWRRYLKRQIARYEITLKQSHVLDRLQHQEYLLPSEIADILYCHRPTATLVVSNLEKQGWVERRPDPEDGRQTRVVITEKGRTKSAEIRQHVWQPLASSFHPLACFGSEEVDELESLIDRLYAHLERICSPG